MRSVARTCGEGSRIILQGGPLDKWSGFETHFEKTLSFILKCFNIIAAALLDFMSYEGHLDGLIPFAIVLSPPIPSGTLQKCVPYASYSF